MAAAGGNTPLALALQAPDAQQSAPSQVLTGMPMALANPATLFPQSLVPSNAAAQAWLNHVNSLSGPEKKRFSEHIQGDLQSYLKTIEDSCDKMQKKSRSIKLVKFFEPLFKVANIYLPIVAAGAQADPNPSALVLGGIMCVLTVSLNFSSYQDRVLDALETMAQKTDMLAKLCGDIYTHDKEVQVELIEVYGSILAFCQQVLKLVVNKNGEFRSGLKTLAHVIVKDFDSTLGQYIAAFEGHSNMLEKKMELCDKRRNLILMGMQQEQMERETQRFNLITYGLWSILGHQRAGVEQLQLEDQRKFTEEKRKQLLQWLPSTSFEKIHDQKFEAHLEGTGKWLLAHETYRSWKHSDTTAFLWIKGKHGCGKSVLAALVIDDIESTKVQDEALVYAYCSLASSESSILASSLLVQMCQQTREIHPSLFEMFDRNAERRASGPSWQQLLRAISAMVSTFPSVYILVDGLDECSDQEKLSKLLCSLVDNPMSRTKVIVLCRPGYPILEAAFGKRPCLIVDSGANNDDIRSVITKILYEDGAAVSNDTALRDSMSEKLLNKAEGMFLWVDLLQSSLRGHRTAAKFVETVNSLLTGLDEVYERSMKRIATQDVCDSDLAFDMLMWTANAKRELKKDELLTAVVVRPGSVKLDDSEKITRSIGLTTACADLLVLDKDGDYQLVHSSLRDYLKSLSEKCPGAIVGYKDRQMNANKNLARICLTYLLFDKFKCGPARTKKHLIQLKQHYPLLSYAALFWAEHVKSSGWEDLNDTILQLAETSGSRELIMQLNLENSKFKILNIHTESMSSLSFLAFFGFLDIIRGLVDVSSLRNGSDADEMLPLHYAFIGAQRETCLWLLNLTERGSIKSKFVEPLHIAASLEWLDVIDRLIELGYDVDYRSKLSRGETALGVATEKSSEAVARELIENRASVNCVDEDGRTPLSNAVENNQQSLSLYLLNNGADINAHGPESLTALHLAAWFNLVPMAKLLIEHGANINAQAPRSWFVTPMHAAAQRNHLDIVKILFSAAADVSAASKNGLQPLATAAQENSLAVVKFLVDNGASLDAADNSGGTALHRACAKDFVDVAEYLCGSGATLEITGPQNYTPLHYASLNKEEKTVRLLLEKGARVDAKDELGLTPLHKAIHSGNTQPAKLLIQAGADANVKDSRGVTPLHFAIYSKSVECVQMILAAGAEIDLEDDEGNSPLHATADTGDVECAKLILAATSRLNMNAENKLGGTALHRAVSLGQKDLVRLLIKRGANINTVNKTNRTPLMDAVVQNFSDIAVLLLENGANNEGLFEGGETILHTAVKCSGEIELIRKLLLDDKTDSLIAAKDGWSAFMSAAGLESPEILEMFLGKGQNGARQISQDGFGCVHISASNGNLQTLERVVSAGADPACKDFFGRTALHCAAYDGQFHMVKPLVDLGLDIKSMDCRVSVPTCAISRRRSYLEFIRRAWQYGADIEKSDQLTNMSLLNLAASLPYPCLVGILIDAGANPLHRDIYGRSALDYAITHERTLGKMGSIGNFYKPLDLAHQRKLLKHAVGQSIRKLFITNIQFGEAKRHFRDGLLNIIGRALCYMQDEDALSLAKICFMECKLSRRTVNKIICDMCGYAINADCYVCTGCLEGDLCSSCHDLYTNNDKRAIITGYCNFIQLEQQLRNVMIVGECLMYYGIAVASIPFTMETCLENWLSEKLEAYTRIMKEHTFHEENVLFEHLGNQFLQFINQGVQYNRAEAQTESDRITEESEKIFRKMARFLSKRDEIRNFTCSGHKYIRLDTEDWEKMKDDSIVLDSDGQITDAWLEQLAARYEISENELNEAQKEVSKLDTEILESMKAAESQRVATDDHDSHQSSESETVTQEDTYSTTKSDETAISRNAERRATILLENPSSTRESVEKLANTTRPANERLLPWMYNNEASSYSALLSRSNRNNEALSVPTGKDTFGTGNDEATSTEPDEDLTQLVMVVTARLCDEISPGAGDHVWRQILEEFGPSEVPTRIIG